MFGHTPGDDETITFSFGSLVDKIKKNLTASASAFGGRKSANAGLAASPPPGSLPKQSLAAASKATSVQRMQAMSDGEPLICSYRHSRLHSIDEHMLVPRAYC